MSAEQLCGSESLGLKEQQMHDIYCLTKTNSSDFLYNHSKQIYRILDAYCGDGHAKKPPLLVIGMPWTGKSSLLSNWFTLRRNTKNESQIISRYAQDEFIFWHSVGSTRSSCYEVNLIQRLFCDLNAYFDLSREESIQSERLRWVLPRLLQTASRKGRMIVIIVDGIDRLVPDDQNESVLSWLPLEPLSNVKIILSATVPCDSPLFRSKDGIASDAVSSRAPTDAYPPEVWSRHGKLGNKAVTDTFEYEGTQRSGTKLLRLLERRPLQVLRLRHLEKKQPERLLVAFIKKTVDLDSLANAVDSVHTLDTCRNEPMLDSNVNVADTKGNIISHEYSKKYLGRINGFLLYPCHVQALLSNRLSANAYFLRLVLGFSSSFCRLRGCSVWPLWARLTAADDIPSLLDTIFHLIESPALTSSSNQSTETDLELIRTCGGLQALFDLYPWHPDLQRLKNTFYAESAATDSDSPSDSTAMTVSMQAVTPLGTPLSSENGMLQDLLRRVSSPLLGPARNKLLESTNHVVRVLNQSVTEEYGETTRLGLSLPSRAPTLSIEEATKQMAENEGVSGARQLSFLNRGLIQQLVAEEHPTEPTAEQRHAADEKKRIEMDKSQKWSEWLEGAISYLAPSNLLHSVDPCSADKGGSASAESVWRESISHFGTALSLLYVSRHGLTEDELLALLANPIASDDTHTKRNDRGRHETSEGKTRPVGMMPRQLPLPVAKTLVKLLKMVGILHSTSFKILNLPPSDDALRNAVFRKCVLPSGGPLLWHRRLISFFKIMPVCVRRCEELPWHQRRVLQWFELKKVLTNLDTFKKMVSCHLKGEYMDLWLLLTRGPMPVAYDLGLNRIGNADHNDIGDSDDPKFLHSRSVHRLEQVVLSGYNHRTIRRQELSGLVAPFDIVQEMNTSVERWKVTARPSEAELKAMLILIGDYLREYSQRLGPGPLFLRPSINLKFFTLLGVAVADLARSEPTKQTRRGVPPLGDEVVTEAESASNMIAVTAARSRANSFKQSLKGLDSEPVSSKGPVEGELHESGLKGTVELPSTFPSANQIDSHLLSYLRWVWMQLPWLALDKVRSIGRRALLEKQRADSADLRPRPTGPMSTDKSPATLSSFRSQSKDASDNPDTLLRVEDVHFPEPVGLIVSQKLLKRLVVSGILPESTASSGVDKRSALSGPTVESTSSKQTLELSNAKSMSRSASTTDIELAEANSMSMITLESSQPTVEFRPASQMMVEYAGESILASDMKRTNRFKYRRNLDEEEEANQGIMFASHSGFSKKRHSLFPSVERAVHDQFAEAEANDEELYATAVHILRLGGKTICDDLNLYKKLDALAEDDLMQEYSLIHHSSAPMTKDEVLIAKHTTKFTRERLGKDSIAYQMKCKLQTLQNLQSRLQQKAEEFERAQEATTMTMDSLQDLQSKYQEVHAVVSDEILVKHGYMQILDVLDKNPANAEHHLAEVEQHVALGQQQLHDLIRFRKKAIEETERANRFRIRQLETKVEYFHEAREILKAKRKKFLEKCGLHEEDVASVLVAMQVNRRTKSSDPHDHQRRYDEADDDSEDGTINLTRSLPTNSEAASGSFQLIKEALSKSLARAKRTESSKAAADIVTVYTEISDLQAAHSFNAASVLFQTIKERYEGHELFSGDQFIQEAVMTLDGKAIKRLSDENSKEYQGIVRKLTVDFLLNRTCSRDEDDFLERLHANEDLNTSLQGTLNAADAVCGTIRSELDQLQRELKALGTQSSYSNDDASAAHGEHELGVLSSHAHSKTDRDSAGFDTYRGQDSQEPLTDEDTEVNRSDTDLVENARQLNLVSNQLARNQKMVLDARTGISHVVNGLHINSRLLYSLPRSSPPTLATDDDINAGLVWIEEKLVAINEAMVIDESAAANAPGKDMNQSQGAEEATVAQRQQKLAVQVQQMLKLGDPALTSAATGQTQQKPTTATTGATLRATSSESASKSALVDDAKKAYAVHANESLSKRHPTFQEMHSESQSRSMTAGDAHKSGSGQIALEQKGFVTSKDHILIHSPEERDSAFSDEMKKLHLRQDKEVQEQEALRREREALLNRPRNVHKFIDDALATPESRKLLRQAKRLSRHVKGPKAFSRYGITLDALLGNRTNLKAPPRAVNSRHVVVVGPASDLEEDSEFTSSKHVSRIDSDD